MCLVSFPFLFRFIDWFCDLRLSFHLCRIVSHFTLSYCRYFHFLFLINDISSVSLSPHLLSTFIMLLLLPALCWLLPSFCLVFFTHILPSFCFSFRLLVLFPRFLALFLLFTEFPVFAVRFAYPFSTYSILLALSFSLICRFLIAYSLLLFLFCLSPLLFFSSTII